MERDFKIIDVIDRKIIVVEDVKLGKIRIKSIEWKKP